MSLIVFYKIHEFVQEWNFLKKEKKKKQIYLIEVLERKNLKNPNNRKFEKR